MVLSAVGPMAAPVGAEHDSHDHPWLSLEVFNDGNWINVDHEMEESPFNVSVDAGTYPMHLTANNLELNMTYNMTWSVMQVEGGTWEMTNETTHTREWFSYTNMSGETWNLTMNDGSCYAVIEAQLETVEPDGTRDHVTGYTFMLWGDCGFNGIVGLSAEIGGSWVDLAAQDSALVLTEGTYDLQWNFNNLSANTSYRFHYLFESFEEDTSMSMEEEYYWTGNDTSNFDTWSVEIDSWDCEMVIDGWLWETSNTSEDELLGGFATFPSGECEEPPEYFELWVDGSLYSEIHHDYQYDECTEYDHDDYECWNEDWDEDADGIPDWTDWQHSCVNWSDDVAGTDWWECEGWSEMPLISEGNHSMVLNVTDLDNDTEYMVYVDTQQSFRNQGHIADHYEFSINTTGMAEPIFEHIAFSVITDNYTCDLHVSAGIYEIEGDGSDHFLDGSGSDFHFNGPCDEPESPFTLTYDGVEWEEEWFYNTYDECNTQDDWDHYECWHDDWDFDGDGEPEMWDHWEHCEIFTDETTNESWWGCQTHSMPPFLDAGNHSLTLLVEDLDENSNYTLYFDWEVCEMMSGCDQEDDYDSFSTSAQENNYTTSGWLETDEYTCDVTINIQLEQTITHEGNWTYNHLIFWDHFRWMGPCDEPESPFTVSMDGVEHEIIEWHNDYDECTEYDHDDYECWNEDWDEDGDGSPDWTDWQNNCESVSDESTGESWWQCLFNQEVPLIGPGNHTFTITVDDLEAGKSYSLGVYAGDDQAGWASGEEFQNVVHINASSTNESFSFWMGTDNHSCGVYIDLNLYEISWHTDNSSNHTWPQHEDDIFYDHFDWRGPCEMPPSPFSLHADGIEYEMIQFYDTYDECTEYDHDYECWNEDWDEDGDGSPDWTNWQNSCENWFDDVAGTDWWECATYSQHPEISEGNHSMQLDMDVDSGESYVLETNYWVHGHMMGHDSFDEILFNATSDLESHFFSIITDNTTCGVDIDVRLHTVNWDNGNWYHDEERGYDNFHYGGPCEYPDFLELWYEDEGGNLTIWEKEGEYVTWDHCDPMGNEYFECWDEGDEYRNWAESCIQLADGTWECIDGYNSPEIEAGNYTMTLVIKELDEGETYELSWLVMGNTAFSQFQEAEQTFEVTAEDLDGDGMADEYQTTWSMAVEPDWCGIQINADLEHLEDYDNDGIIDSARGIAHEWFEFEGPCEADLPVDISLDWFDDAVADWNSVDLVPNDWLFDEPDLEGCEYEEEDLCILLSTDNIFDYPGDYMMRWSMDGLTVGQEYTLMTDVDSYEDSDNGNDWYWCQDGEYDIELHRVNDGYEDCDDGSDEPSYDDDGNENSWFECNNGGEIPLSLVNDGNEDCPDGSDEGAAPTAMITMINASAETEHIEWNYSVSDDTCFDLLIAQLMDDAEEEGAIVGIGLAIIMGPAAMQDDNGDGIPDCLMGSDDQGPEEPDGPLWGSENGNLGFIFTDGSGDPSAVESAWPYMKLEDGLYNVQFETFLEPGINVTFEYEIDAQGRTIIEGEIDSVTDSDGYANTDDQILEISGWDCFVFVGVTLTFTDSGDWIDDYNMMLEGPCEGGSADGQISVDAIDDTGSSWGDPSEGGTYDECNTEDDWDHYECWDHEWDENGDGEPDYTEENPNCVNWFDDVAGTDWWDCPSILDYGQYSFEFDIVDLDPTQEYEITGGAYEGIHGVMDAVELLFATEEPPQIEMTVNGSSDASVTLWGEFYMHCSAFIYLDVFEVDSDEESHDTYYAFFRLPCDDGGGDGPEWGSEHGHLSFVFTDGSADPTMHMEAWPYMQLEPNSYTVGIHAMTDLVQNAISIQYEVEGLADVVMAEGIFDLTTDDYGHAFDDFSFTINGWDCFVNVQIDLEYDDGDGLVWLDEYEMMLEGPCEGGNANGYITVDAIDAGGNSWGDPNDNSLDEGDWEFGIEISSMSEGVEYMVSAGVWDNIHGVKDVMEQLSVAPPQVEMTIIADSTGMEGFSFSSYLGEKCSGFVFVDVWYMDDAQEDDHNHDTYYSFFELPGCDDDGEDDLVFDPTMFAIAENYHAVFWGEDDMQDGLMFTVGSSMPLDVSIREKIDADFGNNDGITTADEADMFLQAFLMMIELNNPMNYMYPCVDDASPGEIPLMLFNDGYEDCSNGSDEPSYDDDGNENSWFACWDEDETVILMSKVNNGIVDCPNGIDEPAMMVNGPEGLTSDGQAPLWTGPQEIWFDSLTSDSTHGPALTFEWLMVFEDLSPGDSMYELSFAGDDDEGDSSSSLPSEVCGETGFYVNHIYDISSAVVNGTEIPFDGSRACFEFQGEPMPPFTITWSLNETADTDGDGEPDDTDDFPFDPTETKDTDGDGWGDNSDAFPTDPNEWVDTDGDGVGDNADTDADGDGVNDDSEDSDGDGVNDDLDAFPFDANETTDTDGDGVGDNSDAFPNDANETTDTDGDGIGDNSDDDADGDGTPNGLDDFPLNSAESTDSDGDGVGDTSDAFPTDPNEWADADGDLTGDNADDDDDNDGVKDVNDAFPFDASEDTDSDSDGVGDNADAFPNDPYERTDSDGDGVGDNADDFPSDPSEWADSDNDGVGNNQDAFDDDPNEIADTDEDGVGNNADQCEGEKEDSNDGDGCPETSSEDTEPDDDDDGGLLPGFSATLGMISLLGAASLASGRRKD